MATFTERFREYFDRDVAQKAAKSLSNGSEIEFQVSGADTFTFTRTGSINQVHEGSAKDPQIVIILTPAAAEQILNDPAAQNDDIASIGIGIMKLVVSQDPSLKVRFQIKAGFLGLFTKGYFGVLTAGGSQFATFLASKGLDGMGAIKAALGKLKK